jgi:hypothetical protein
VQLCTQKIDAVNYGYSVTQSHSYCQVHLLAYFYKYPYITSLVCHYLNKDRGFQFIVMHYNESWRRIRGSELTLLLSPQVYVVQIITDLR